MPQQHNLYNLINTQVLEISKCRKKSIYGLNTTVFKGALLWNKLPKHFKEAKSLIYFKKKLGNGQGGRVLVASALTLFTNKKCTYLKKTKPVVIYLYFQLLYLLILVLLFIFVLINLFKPVIFAFIY